MGVSLKTIVTPCNAAELYASIHTYFKQSNTCWRHRSCHASQKGHYSSSIITVQALIC